MKKLIQLVIVTSLASTMLTSCYYDKKSEIAPKITDDIVDTTKPISYLNNVVPILKDKCYGCHSGAGVDGNGIAFDTYVKLTDSNLISIADGRLLGTIKNSSGYSPMPKNSPKMEDTKITTIELWIKQGHKNN